MSTKRCVFYQYVIFSNIVMLTVLCYCSYASEHYDVSRSKQAFALQITTSTSYHASTGMVAINQDDSESDHVFIHTTDDFTNTTESEYIFNKTIIQSTVANKLLNTRTHELTEISQTDSTVSIKGSISYVNSNPSTLFTTSSVYASKSFSNYVKPNTKGKASTPERRQLPGPTDDIKLAMTTFIRQHKHYPTLFQHHLQLMPMDHEPFDPDLIKDHRYVLSVLVPICVVAIGAAMIMITVFSLRYIARRRAVGEFPLTGGSSVEKQAQSLSRISSEQTDRLLLLSVEDDADM